MSEPIAFSSLLATAFRLVGRRKIHYTLMLLLGSVAVLGYILSQKFLLSPPQDSADISEFLFWFFENKITLALLGLMLICINLLEALLRGPLILVLEETIQIETQRFSHRKMSLSNLLKAIRTSGIIALVYSSLILLLLGISLLPVVWANLKNPIALPGVFQLAFLFFFSLSIFLYFIKEYALFYALLSRVPIKSAFELGYSLLHRNLFPSFLFGLLILSLSLIFTFILDSAIILIAPQEESFFGTSLILIFILSGVFGIYEQLVRLLFFHQLAAPKGKVRLPHKAVSTENIPESIT